MSGERSGNYTGSQVLDTDFLDADFDDEETEIESLSGREFIPISEGGRWYRPCQMHE
jgi:hypothetical protein